MIRFAGGKGKLKSINKARRSQSLNKSNLLAVEANYFKIINKYLRSLTAFILYSTSHNSKVKTSNL